MEGDSMTDTEFFDKDIAAVRADISRLGFNVLERLLSESNGTSDERELLALSFVRQWIEVFDNLDDIDDFLTRRA